MFNLSKFKPSVVAQPLERRMAPRRNTYIEAEISFDNIRLPCIIRDVSEGGAKLEVAKVAGIPNLFQLHAPGHRPQACRVAWRAMREMGVAYLDLD